MSRSDQFIGLTDEAKKFMDELQGTPGAIIESSKIGEYVYTFGSITGLKVTIPVEQTKHEVNKQHIYEEVIQREVWSSGPMYFTHIKHTLIKNCGQKIDMGYYFSWVDNPNLKKFNMEFDSVKGHFYI